MAASLPIVASDMPAHASIVAHGETGLLCNSPGELAAALDRLEIADANTAFGEAGRRRMTAKIGTWDDCAHSYRSEKRRGGKECVRTCRSGGSPDSLKKKKKTYKY